MELACLALILCRLTAILSAALGAKPAAESEKFAPLAVASPAGLDAEEDFWPWLVA